MRALLYFLPLAFMAGLVTAQEPERKPEDTPEAPKEQPKPADEPDEKPELYRLVDPRARA